MYSNFLSNLQYWKSVCYFVAEKLNFVSNHIGLFFGCCLNYNVEWWMLFVQKGEKSIFSLDDTDITVSEEMLELPRF